MSHDFARGNNARRIRRSCVITEIDITQIRRVNLSFIGSQSISLNSFFLDEPDYLNLDKIEYTYFGNIGFYLKAPL